MPKILTGTVISTKMQKTVVVRVNSKVRHPLYKKLINQTKKFKVHDEIGVQTGQTVKIIETKPISKTVKFKIMEVSKSEK
jgi:small subunit ribosomal protein S17